MMPSTAVCLGIFSIYLNSNELYILVTVRSSYRCDHNTVHVCHMHEACLSKFAYVTMVDDRMFLFLTWDIRVALVCVISQ